MSAARSPAPLPPWLKNGGGGARPPSPRSQRALRALRGPALVLAAALAGCLAGWLLHAWRQPAPVSPLLEPVVEAPRCPDPEPCTGGGGTGSAATTPAHARGKKPPLPLALHALPPEGPSEDGRRAALRAFAEQKAGDLRACLQGPARGPLRRVGAALEIDSHGTVAAVQILGGEGSSRELESCYSARLRTWRFPQALMQGDQRLLVNFVL